MIQKVVKVITFHGNKWFKAANEVFGDIQKHKVKHARKNFFNLLQLS